MSARTENAYTCDGHFEKKRTKGWEAVRTKWPTSMLAHFLSYFTVSNVFTIAYCPTTKYITLFVKLESGLSCTWQLSGTSDG
jgi:hypothetical protein